MSKDLLAKVREFVGIAKECPQHLQEKCFEVLLADYLSSSRPPYAATKPPAATADEAPKEKPPAPEQADIQETGLHIKARKFLAKYSVSVGDLNQILYREGDQFLPLYEDLKTTRAAESQIRVGLLHALVSGLQTGEFQFDGEEVRKECQQRKCYDAANFTANFKNNASLFDGFSRYAAKSPTIRLSHNGRQELAELIRELR